MTIDVPQGDLVYLDRTMFSSIMRNLVSNAIKFTHRGGRVRVEASIDASQLTITVSDNGIGMSPASMDHLYALNSASLRPGTEGEPSTGLGLVLCREFVERHGGSIHSTSTEGAGSTFRVTFPNAIAV